MTIASGAMALMLLVIGVPTDGDSIAGSRIFYASRLVGALVVATLVPLLIDRRLRR